MDKIHNFIKTSVVYFVGNIFTKLLSFLLLPLYTNKIHPQEYGEYGLVMILLQLVIPIVYFSIWDGIFRVSYDKEDTVGKHKIINNGVIVLAIGTIITIIGGYICSSLFVINYIGYIIPTGILIAIQYFYSCSARALGDSRFFIWSGCINSAIMITSNCILIGKYNMGIEVVYLSYIVGTLIQIVILEIKDKILLSFKIKDIEKEVINSCFRFSFPVAVNAVIIWFLLGFTQYAVTSRLGTYYNGQFNVANKFSAVITLMVNVIQFAWYEMAYEISKDDNLAVNYYTKMLDYLLKTVVVLYPVILFSINIIYPYYIGVMYQESLILIPLLILGTIFSAYSGFLGTVFMAYRDTAKLMVSIVLAGLFNVIVTLCFIDKVGLIGAVVIFCIANFINVSVRIVQLKKGTEIKFEIRKRYCFLMGASIIAFYLLNAMALTIIGIFYVFLLLYCYKKSILTLIYRVKEKKENSRMESNYITVFTPVYNRAYCVKDVYDSLVRQSYTNFEWLVINDGSSDDTDKVIKKCIEQNKITIRYYYQKNGGQHRALNKGIEKADGNLFMIVDSDDYLTDDALYWINYYENSIKDKRIMAGVSGLRRHKDGTAIGCEWSSSAEYIDALNNERCRYKELLRDKAEAYYTAVLRKYAPIPEFENENDVEKGVLWNRIAKGGYKVRWFNKKVYVCEYLEDGMSTNIISNYIKNYQGYTLYEKEHVHMDICLEEKIKSIIRYYEVSKEKAISDTKIAENIAITPGKLKFIKLLVNNKSKITRIYHRVKKPTKL